MYSQDKADRICQELAEGKTLRQVCSAEGMPAPSTVLLWTKAQPGFSEQYARARELGYQLLADELLEISDRSESDSYEDKDGNVKTNTEVVARSRLMVDTRKWMLSKMLPKVYGDKIDLNHSGRIAVAREMTDEELSGIAAGGGI